MTRGGGKAFVFGGPLATGGGGLPSALDLSTWGTFTRSTEASRQLAAAGTGATAFIAWSPPDKRRIDYQSGSPMLLMEGSRVNQVLSTEYDFARAGGGWSVPGGNTLTSTVFTHPDGSVSGGQLQVTSGSTGTNVLKNPVTINQDWVASYYARSPSGTTSTECMIGGGTVTATGTNALTTTWQRLYMNRLPDDAFGQLAFWLNDGRDWSAYGGVSAGARDSVMWGVQLEQASWASSPIRSPGYEYGTQTRAADALSGAMNTIPVKMINGAWAFTCAPTFSSAAGIRDATDKCLFSFDETTGERIFFVVSGGSIYLRVTSGGATKVTSNALTFSAHQVLTVSLDGTAGSIAVSGATSGNGTVTGTAWTRSAGATLYVGNVKDGSQPAWSGIWGGSTAPTPSTKKIAIFTLGQSNMSQHACMDRVAAWMQEYYQDVKLVDGSMGSTSLYVDWDPTTGTQYAAALAKWDAAVTADPTLTGYTPFIVWCQGESDAGNATYAAAYGTKLPAMFTALETDRPFFAGCKKSIVRLCINSQPTGYTAGQISQVRTGQTDYVNASAANRALINTDDLTLEAPTNIHFDDASIWTLAQRMVQGAIAVGL